MKYSIVTFGCRVNQADSLRLEEDLRARGAVEAASRDADLVIVNTCSVTATADQGARQAIRRIARENPGARIVATGCYATRCSDEVAALPGVVRVVRNDEKLGFLREWLAERTSVASERAGEFEGRRPSSLRTGVASEPRERSGGGGPASERAGEFEGRRPSSLRTSVASEPRERSGGGGPASERAGEFEGRSPSSNNDGPCGSTIEPGVAGRTAFTIRAQTGCEERCAYCIIPSTRGASRSLPADALVREVERVAAAGFKEVTIAGVHLGSYGRDLSPSSSLIDLLRALDGVRGDVTFRISSLEPMDCTPEIVAFVSAGGRFLPHFHLPLQHASDRVLAAMRRPYTLDDYRRLLDAIVARLPHASIGSDMIAGFPGERDEDFAANLAYLPASPLTHLHVFPYSDRPGTEATAMPGKVHGAIVRDRGAQLRSIGAALSARFRAAQSGTVRPGLTLEDGTLVVTDNYLKVRIAPGHARNERVAVRLMREGSEMRGEIVAA